ncbi:hypothetical protein JXM83_01560 [Candidatus Woesearchaeota archaeon]|nr:hypothetical protein [Candidatus Woesearchaeota archaeon]
MIDDFKKNVKEAFLKIKSDIHNLVASRDSLFDEVGKINGSIDDVSLRVSKVESGVSKLKVEISDNNSVKKSAISDSDKKVEGLARDVASLKKNLTLVNASLDELKSVKPVAVKKEVKIDVSKIKADVESSVLSKVLSDFDLQNRQIDKVTKENSELRTMILELKAEVSSVRNELENSRIAEEISEIKTGSRHESIVESEEGINLEIPSKRAPKFETKKNQASMTFMPEPWSKVSGYKRVKKQNDFW